jgi:hypothetical protein
VYHVAFTHYSYYFSEIMSGTPLGLEVGLMRQVEPSPADGVHFFLDEKTNQKNQGCAGIGYLRSSLR